MGFNGINVHKNKNVSNSFAGCVKMHEFVSICIPVLLRKRNSSRDKFLLKEETRDFAARQY